jgi:hypothetical protein
MTLLTDSAPKARKHHRCDDCGGWIAPGEVYRLSKIQDDGTVYPWRQHLDCFAMAHDVDVAEGNWCEGGRPPLCQDEGVLEELDSWRGCYPHVVCRIELQQQLYEARRD